MEIASTTWKCSLGWGLRETSQIRDEFAFLSKRGWLRIYILYVDKSPCAFLVGSLYDKKCYCQYAGYRSEFARFSVGSLLLAWASQNVAAAGAEDVEFGEGNQDYNRRLGCKVCLDGPVHIYPRTLRGFWLNMFFTTTQIIQTACDRTQLRLGMSQIRKAWREFLVIIASRKDHKL